MNNEREMDRHNKIIKQIKDAKNRAELPNISLSNISSYLASNVYFDDRHISQTMFKPVLDAIIDYNFFIMPQVKNVFLKVLKENYPNKSEEDYLEKYNMIANSPRIMNILVEVSEKNARLKEFQDNDEIDYHNKIMKNIGSAYEIKDLPKVGITELNKRIQRCFNDNDFIRDIKISSLRNIKDAYMSGVSLNKISDLVYNYCNKQSLSEDNKKLMAIQIINNLSEDKVIKYIVEEIKAKEKRKLKIYEIDHNDTMEIIKSATRISQLPPNLTSSVLSSYLSGNSIIFKNGDKVSTTDLKNVVDMLLSGKKWEDKSLILELQNICVKYYKNKAEVSFRLLYDKFKSLPRTYYLVEEINASNKRQKEFISNSFSNVNVYFIPNNKGPIDGGRFYNCYINRVDNLNLGELLPLNLEEIVPPEMDIDSVEWFIQEYYDKTFKAAGGIILNKDETIGNVNVFRPNDGTIGITKEEKNKYDELRDLSEQVKDIIKRKKEETDNYGKMQEQFLKMQEEFLKSQRNTDKELSELEARIRSLTKNTDDDLGRGSR